MLKLQVFDKSGNYITGGYYSSQQEINKTLSSPINVTRWGGSGNFTHTVTDATLEIEEKNGMEQSERAFIHGQKCMALVRHFNKKALQSGEMTDQEFAQILSNPVHKEIERALWNGSFQFAVALIQTLDNSLYSSDDKQKLVSLINQFQG